MNMEKEMMYETPVVEVLEVEMEQGFAGSPQVPDMEEGDSGDAE